MITNFPVSIFQNVALGVVLALIASLIAIRYARRVGLMDIPGREAHKLHTQPTPIAGGLALVGVLFFAWAVNQKEFGDLWEVLLPALLIFMLGLWDDFHHVLFWIKLLVETVAALLLISLGIQVHAIGAVFTGIPVSIANIFDLLITVFWIVGMTNAYNFVDSMDGLALGIAVITSIFLAFTSLLSGQMSLALFMALLTGACIGINYFNSNPARLFLGDSGSLTLGFLLSATTLLYNPKFFPQPSSWFVPVMILGLPIFDVTLVVVSRFRRGKPLHRSDRGHVYHRLVAMGFSPNQSVMLLHIAALLLDCLAFTALNLPPLASNAIFIGTVLTGIGCIVYLDDRRRWL